MKIIEEREGYLFVYYDGSNDVESLTALMKEIGEICRSKNIHKLLADMSNMPGESRTIDRFRLGASAVFLLRGITKTAIVYREDALNRFAEDVAVNRGLPSLITDNMQTAKRWLGVE